MSNKSSNKGVAVISFDLSSTFIWPKHKLFFADQALTKCIAEAPKTLSNVLRIHLPSISPFKLPS